MPGRTLSLKWQYNPTLDAPAKYRRACKYQAFVPVPLADLSVSLDLQLAGLASEAEAAIRELNAAARPGLAPLGRLLLRTESIASSRVEGLQIGLRELARSEAKQDAGEKIAPTAAEILANIDAMELAVHNASTAGRFSVDQITAIHHALLARTSKAHIAGKLRTTQNWIGGNDYNPCGSDFVPPPPEYVGELLADLCAAIDDDVLPPLAQAALVHAQFETIHPFEDGNGRTGRALIHVVFRRRGVAPSYVPSISVLFARDRDRYIAGLTSFRREGVTEWIELFASVTRRAAKLASVYLKQVERLQNRWRELLAALPSAPRTGATAWEVIDILPAHPVVTAPVAAAAAHRSRPQTYQALEQLQAAGVLIRTSSGKRNRSWEASGLLDLLARLEAGELPDGDSGAMRTAPAPF